MKLSIKDIPGLLAERLEQLRRYAIPLFLVVVVAVYGYLLLRISTMQNAQPSSISTNQKVTTAATPRIDPKVVQQLQQLQDNSVSVKSLFDQARSNPFQE